MDAEVKTFVSDLSASYDDLSQAAQYTIVYVMMSLITAITAPTDVPERMTATVTNMIMGIVLVLTVDNLSKNGYTAVARLISGSLIMLMVLSFLGSEAEIGFKAQYGQAKRYAYGDFKSYGSPSSYYGGSSYYGASSYGGKYGCNGDEECIANSAVAEAIKKIEPAKQPAA